MAASRRFPGHPAALYACLASCLGLSSCLGFSTNRPPPDGADFDAIVADARLEDQKGAFAAAAAAFQKALAIRPEDYGARLALAKDEVQLGRLKQARTEFARARKVNPKEATAYIEEGYADINAGRQDQAEQAFAAYIAANPEDPDGYHHMAAYWNRRGDPAKAERFMNESLAKREADPHASPKAVLNDIQWLGGILEEEGRSKQARALYLSGLEKSKSDPDYRATFATALAKEDRDDKSVLALKEALAACGGGPSCDPLNAGPALTVLADLYIDRKQVDEAERALAEVLEIYGSLNDKVSLGLDENAEKFIRIGQLYVKLGDDGNAERAYRRVLDLRKPLSSSVQLQTAETALADLLAKSNRAAEAESFYLDAIRIARSRGSDIQDLSARLTTLRGARPRTTGSTP